MASQHGSEPDSVRLSEDAAAVLLARATELDAAGAGRVSIAELRQAARDAGIAPEAFEQALSELRAASAVAAVERPGRRRWRRYWMAGIVLATLLLVFVSSMVFPVL
jgi:hypothetical protein